MSDYPPWITRAQAATLVSTRFFQVSRRSIERWPVNAKRLGHRTTVLSRDEVVAYAQAKLDGAKGET